MDNTLTQDLKKQFDSLPPELQRAISGIDLSEKLQEIVKKHRLMIDQAGKLEIETVLVLFGLERLEKYIKNLTDNVGLSNIQAAEVAHDVNEVIFKGVREILKKINDGIAEQEKAEDKVIKDNRISKDGNPTKEDVLAGIENPTNINSGEESVSISSQKSNNPTQEVYQNIGDGVEIRPNSLPEITPDAIKNEIVMMKKMKPVVPLHQNVAPVNDIVKSKMTETVIVPKKNITVEEKTKLPEKTQQKTDDKPKTSGDPYREPII